MPTSAAEPAPDIVGVILAGGQSRRMGGGDKTLLDLLARPILDHVIERFGRQTRALVLNANGDLARFRRYNLPVVADPIDGFEGPLAGILAGLKWARENAAANNWVASVPCDTPFLPVDLVRRLLEVSVPSSPVVARSRNRVHPVVGLWPVALATELSDWLFSQPRRSAHAWLETQAWTAVDFEDESGVDPFFNVNTPVDLRTAERHAAEGA